MLRITKRNEDGTVSIDGLAIALERLAEYEDNDLTPDECMSAKLYANRISKLHDCNDCGRDDCKYKPEWGAYVVINCPGWETREDSNDDI